MSEEAQAEKKQEYDAKVAARTKIINDTTKEMVERLDENTICDIINLFETGDEEEFFERLEDKYKDRYEDEEEEDDDEDDDEE